MWRNEPDGDLAGAGVEQSVIESMAARFADAVADGSLFSGAQMAMYRHGRLVLDVGGGVARPRVGAPVTPDTMFVIFSSTKGLAALAMWMLHERGAFDFDDLVLEHWPSFNSRERGKDKVTIRHVMGHRGGFPTGPEWFTARWWDDREAMVRAAEEAPLRWTPGEANGYHPLNFGWVLNELCMRLDRQGRDMGRFLREEAFDPLGAEGIHLGLPDDPELEELVAWCEEPVEPLEDQTSSEATGGDAAFRAPIRDDRHRATPELSIPWNRPAVHRAVVPGAGAVACARDLARVYAALALGGELDGVRLISSESIEAAIVPTNAPGEIDRTLGRAVRWGTGWRIGSPASQLLSGTETLLETELADGPASGRVFGHPGRGGQAAWADLELGVSFAFLTTGELGVRAYRAWLHEMQTLAVDACRAAPDRG
jgi:CubicO group peptidase (beta-lactamase class C family)